MAEFRFDIKPLFPEPIVKITSSLLPHTFKGDRRTALDTTSKMSEIIDHLGVLSASSQRLSKAVTTAQKLRMTNNQTIYLLADTEAGHNGAVIGLLKVGTKSLYLFDEKGDTQKVDDTPCILDFYIHESRQRAGLGKNLFEAMLADEGWTPIKLSIDRPSEKLLGFLKKHYGMEKVIPQANNFVLYEGFFGSPSTANDDEQQSNGLHITDSPNTALFGPHYIDNEMRKKLKQKDSTSSIPQVTQISPVGRYAAPRPTCSMAETGKRDSEISLTPSQISKLEKTNAAKKNPLDAITRPPKINQYLEKRSGLQPVVDDTFNNYFSQAPPKGSGARPPPGRTHANQAFSAQQQQAMAQQSGQPSIVPQQYQPPMGQYQQAPQYQQQLYNQQYLPQYQQYAPQYMQAQQYQQLQQQANAMAAGGRNPIETDFRAPPSEPKYDDTGNIIHSGAAPKRGETSSGKDDADEITIKGEDVAIDSVCEDLQNLQTSRPEPDIELANIDAEVEHHSILNATSEHLKAEHDAKPEMEEGAGTIGQLKKPTSFQLSKQHTGLKNISFNVGMAVTPTNKMEFEQEKTDEFGVLKINRPPGKLVSPPPQDNSDAISTVSSGEGYTDQGYYDLKFYHNKLW